MQQSFIFHKENDTMIMYGDFWPACVDQHYRIHLFILNYNILSCQVQTCQCIFLAAISKSRHIHNLPVQCEKEGLRIQNEAALDTKEDGYQGEAEPEEANRGCPHLEYISLEEHFRDRVWSSFGLCLVCVCASHFLLPCQPAVFTSFLVSFA